MPIDTHCPSCGTRLRIPSKLVGSGRAKKCPKCNGPLPIVSNRAAAAKPPASRKTGGTGRKRSAVKPGASKPPRKKKVRSPTAESYDVDLVTLTQLHRESTPCPHCGQPIAPDARLAGQMVTCPYCHQQLRMGGTPRQLPTISCPYCRGHIPADPALAGQVVGCPHCRGQVLIPR
jgi:hypothetical protein